MRTDPRAVNDHDRGALMQIPLEPLREQVFAACGYAFAGTAAVFGLLTPHLGRLSFIAGIVLTALLVPVNLCLIRRFARLRRSSAAHHTAALAGREDRTASQRRTPQR